MLSRLVSGITTPFPLVKAKIGMNLFHSSAFWSDEILVEPKEQLVGYITIVVEYVGTVRFDGFLSAREMLLFFKH